MILSFKEVEEIRMVLKDNKSEIRLSLDLGISEALIKVIKGYAVFPDRE